MMNHPRSSSPEDEESSRLTDREQEIARRVRESLHLSASMSVDEVAQQFRDSVAWRRERLSLAGEKLREKLSRAGRFLLRKLRSWMGTGGR